MAHYALINSENIVVQVITGVDENVKQIDLDGSEVGGSSESWENFYQSLSWFSGFYCKRTSYNGKIRKNYAGIGYFYDEVRDAFIPPKPYKSWVLNESTCNWEPPISYPLDGNLYNWDEENQKWTQIIKS